MDEHVCTQATLIQQMAKQIEGIMQNDREDNKILSEFIVISKMNVESNQELSKTMGDIVVTLNNMNLSLENMNQEIKNTNINFENLKSEQGEFKKFVREKFDNLEQKQIDSDDKSIIRLDTRVMVKKFFLKLFFPISSIGAIVFFVFDSIKKSMGK